MWITLWKTLPIFLMYRINTPIRHYLANFEILPKISTGGNRSAARELSTLNVEKFFESYAISHRSSPQCFLGFGLDKPQTYKSHFRLQRGVLSPGFPHWTHTVPTYKSDTKNIVLAFGSQRKKNFTRLFHRIECV